MKVPNALWISILVGATTLTNQYFGEYAWAPIALAVIGYIIKLVEVNVAEPSVSISDVEPLASPRGLDGAPDVPGKVHRFFLD